MKKLIVGIITGILILSAGIVFYNTEKQDHYGDAGTTSGTDIASMVENYKTFEVDGGGTFHNLTDATRYEMITNESDYKVEAIVKNGVKCIKINEDWVDNLGWGNTFLMKDKKIVEITFDGIYNSDISEIDALVFADSKVVRIMPNPLYKGN